MLALCARGLVILAFVTGGALPASAQKTSPAEAEVPAALASIPADALGFVYFSNLEKVDAAVQKLAATFKAPALPPLALLQVATGLGPGLDKTGDVAIAFLPGVDDKLALVPLVAAEVTNYADFVAPLQGDVTGEICRVTIAGEEMLVAQADGLALLMNVEHRDTLQRLKNISAPASPELKQLADWVAANQATIALMPKGVEFAWQLGKEGLSESRKQYEELYSDEAFAENVAQVRRSYEVLELLLGDCSDDFAAVAIGLSVSDAGDLRLGKRALLKPNSRLAVLGEGAAPNPDAWRGFADQPFVLAAAGPVTKAFPGFFTSLGKRIIAIDPDEFGYGGIAEEEWHAVLDKQSAMYQLSGAAVVLLPGKEDDPIVSNAFGRLDVEDASQLLNAWEQGLAADNELYKKSTSEIAIANELERREVAGKPALCVTNDVAEALADENVPFMDAFAKELLGEDGKFHTTLAASDARTVNVGIGPDGPVADFIAATLTNERGLAASNGLKTTTALLDPAAPWQAYLSPQGSVAWAARIAGLLSRRFGGGEVEIPAFPATPPIGFSMKIADDCLAGEMVWPAATLAGLADYIETVQKEMAEQ